MASREKLGGYLADRRWMDRVLDQTYAGMNELAEAGRYPFPVGADGTASSATACKGPEYMRRMRIARPAGRASRILDHSPALELLVDADGAVAGAARLPAPGERDVPGARAGAVVLATGGCAFLSAARWAATSTPATAR